MTYFVGDFNTDCGLMFSFLEEVYFYSGTERQNMIRHRNDNTKGSMNYGYTWKGYLKRDENGNKIFRTPSPYKGLYKTKVMDDYPELEFIFKEFQEKYFPSFDYTSVQMNKNFKCPRHIDGTNVGESVLLCLGDYTGGELVVEYPSGDKVIDNKNGIYKFNGALYYHYVKDFVGTRYSLVFFNNKNMRKRFMESAESAENCP